MTAKQAWLDGGNVLVVSLVNEELELTFGTETIVGWRVWQIIEYTRRDGTVEPRLAPLSASDTWTPRRRMEARCSPTHVRLGGRGKEAHDAPWPTCDCGIWSVRTRAEAEASVEQERKRGLDMFRFGYQRTHVFGPVHLWGRVLEFEKGYRAQYAYPERLYFTGSTGTLSRDVGELYGIPVQTLKPPDPPAPAEDARTIYPIYRVDTADFTRGLAQAQQSLTQIAKAMGDAGGRMAELAELDVEGGLARPKLQRPPRPRPTIKDAFRGPSVRPAQALG